MYKFLSNLIAQFREFFKTLTPIKRISMLTVIAIVIVFGAIVIVMVSGQDYSVLLRDIPDQNLPLVMKHLKDKNIPFKVVDGGKSISVPSTMLHATQMFLMSEIGTAQIGSVGLELFDKQDFGTTSYAQRINYQRALQGELIRAINSLDVVKQSKVILAIPAKKTFLEEGSEASASVVVDLHPGKKLSAEQVRGITALVSSAVEGLSQSKVSIVDSNGKMLSKTNDISTSGSTELIELQKKVESEFENRIESILSKVVGTTKVIAKVNVSLNPKKINTVEESVDPEKSAVRSIQTEEESLNGARTNPVGVPGARANLPGAQDGGQVGFNQNVKKELKTTNYEIPKIVKNISESAGSIEKLSVAVLVDGNSEIINKENGEKESVWKPRSPEELTKYESLIMSAIGFNKERGDFVKVENIKFSKEDFGESEQLITSLERRKLVRTLAWWSLLGFCLSVFFFVIVRPFMRWITDSFQDTVDDMLPRTIEELEELHAGDTTLPGMSGALPILEESIDPNKAEAELLKDRILTIMEKDEAKAASAIGLWFTRKDA